MRSVPELVNLAERQGFRVRRTRKGFMVYAKIRERGSVTLHLTCSDHRAIKNALTELRKIGVEVD